MGFQSLPHSLEMDKLFLDVRLDAIPLLGTNFVDLTGSKTFTVGMMRNNKGFGITDINIETKSSLQPIVEITFKDMYGNTVFENLNDAGNSDNNGKLDYSLLFDWPPPKFRFTFKGYLGNPVTWIMNLKKTTTRYASNDGSYEIKATFVPNQWGFLADIPFLYLLAKKRLKRDLLDAGSNTTNVQKQAQIDSIFDIIKVGKTIETKTKQVSKEFDKLQKQLSVLKATSVDGLINKDFEPNDVIDGSVAGRQPIKGVKGVYGQNDLGGFTKIKITMPASLNISDSIKFQETLKAIKSDGNKIQVENRKIIALIGGASNSGMETIGVEPPNKVSFQDSVKAGVTIIDNNLKLIEIETKRRLFETTSTQLGMVTISEVFSRISADGAFILGSILDAGYKGYYANTGIRTQNKLPSGTPLIGKFFPLTIDASSGEQVPATEAGIEEVGAEMDFVRKFIVAISQGIAENQASQGGDDSLSSQEEKLPARINNLEIINPNPYKDLSGQQLLETLLIRSGIATFITRSFDPNKPGDYDSSIASLKADNDSAEEIKQLADKELKNITDSIISTLPVEDYNFVKEFCNFINNLFDVDGEGFLNFGADSTVIPIPDSVNEIKKHVVYGKLVGPDKIPIGTVEDKFLRKFLGTGNTKSIFFQGQPQQLTDSINYDTLTAGYLYNNNTLWMLPRTITNEPSFVLFKNTIDQSAIDGVSNNDSDSSFNDKKNKETDEPLGIVKVSNGNEDEDKNPDEFERLKTLNNAIGDGGNSPRTVFDYSLLQGITSLPTIKEGEVYYPDVNNINDSKGVFITTKYNETNIGNGITYTVYSNVTSDSEPWLTWGLFRNGERGDRRGKNQRIFLRRICVDLENRMNKLEDEKNNVLSQVLGKAQSSENSLYIQMHHIFHQWGVLGFEMNSTSTATNKNSSGNNKISEQKISEPGEMAIKLEEDYANIVEVDSNGKMLTSQKNIVTGNPGGSVVSMGFRYDFPMERINPPKAPNKKTNVGHSIINIDPLYKPNANTTLLNIIQQLCTKNNFMFVPIPGNVDYTNISDIFKPKLMKDGNVGNVFHVLFTPTPENRSKQNDGTPIDLVQGKKNFDFDAFEVEFGSPDNPVIKSLDVSTEDSKPTAESILNLQRLVDKDNSNKAVTTDCSVLSVMEGRSYKMKIDMIGNGQLSPMQYFYVAKMPIFSGLYQVMNVTHSIKPNDMTTSIEGIRMRFDGSNMKGITPITIESLKALADDSNMVEPIASAGGSSSPFPPAPTNIYGFELPTNIPVTSDDEIDLIPGTYLTNSKQPIQLAQIDGRPVEVKTAKAYISMFKAAKQEGVKLKVNSAFRPQWGTELKTMSSKGIEVTSSTQEELRRELLKPEYPNPNSVLNPSGKLVSTSSPTLSPQSKYFKKAVAPPGFSNHGNGISLDLNTGTRVVKPPLLSTLNKTVYTWLIKNGWKYGFVRVVKTEEWHFDYRPDLAKKGPYGALGGDTIEKRNALLFYTDLGLSNITIA